MKAIRSLLLFLAWAQFTFGATGYWNAVQCTAIDGVAQTSWNGTGISSASAGPSVWYNAGSAPDTGYNISTNTIWSNITVSSAGSCTKLRIYCQTYYSTKTAFLALYSGQSGPLSGGTASVSITGTGWFEATLASPVAVTAGTYQVAAIVDSGGVQIGGHGDTGITAYLQGEDLSTFPPATLVTNFASYSNQSWGLGMWVQ